MWLITPKSFLPVAVTILLFGLILTKTSALQCYFCNSLESCEDPDFLILKECNDDDMKGRPSKELLNSSILESKKGKKGPSSKSPTYLCSIEQNMNKEITERDCVLVEMEEKAKVPCRKEKERNGTICYCNDKDKCNEEFSETASNSNSELGHGLGHVSLFLAILGVIMSLLSS